MTSRCTLPEAVRLPTDEGERRRITEFDGPLDHEFKDKKTQKALDHLLGVTEFLRTAIVSIMSQTRH